ncbi:hypothetical protein ASPZODRAFT_143917 [Penicilliopsis zonata CBS 506.65]|uniref:Uncharacterized protein n=1 Tax=Penicilliopsis zonata CBS 506.65 TaxID=1073090 RepID=A0A1L9SDV9_9EURO|nr:hypothetical protein ASPZODRAFT_143917 [Penicilliopsis zonata CBS 506.65]OJJ45274.1 hypothetical protein ASPZODRAFT_143917 [Penicilliopsis zonata CBS 506.65]
MESSPVTTHNPPDSFPTSYSHVVTVDGPARLIYTAGQVGRDSNGQFAMGFENQVRLAYENLGRCLESVNASPRDIVKLTWYIANYDPLQRAHVAINEAFLGGHRPAITLVPVPQLASPQMLFEVEAVAAIRDRAE